MPFVRETLSALGQNTSLRQTRRILQRQPWPPLAGYSGLDSGQSAKK